MKYLESGSFAVGSGGSKAYRDNWNRIFNDGKESGVPESAPKESEPELPKPVAITKPEPKAKSKPRKKKAK